MAKAKKVAAPKPHPIKDLLTYFDKAYRARFDKPYRVLGGRDAKIAKDLLAVPYEMVDLQRWIDAFFISFDQRIRESNYDFAAFSWHLGKLIAAEKPAPHLKPRTLRTLQGLYGD